MSERKISLDDYVNELPLGAASYRNKIKIVLKDFAKELLELAAENSSVILYIDSVKESSMKEHCIHRNNMEYIYTNDKQSILDTIKQVE